MKVAQMQSNRAISICVKRVIVISEARAGASELSFKDMGVNNMVVAPLASAL
jgi:hypothetical protein